MRAGHGHPTSPRCPPALPLSFLPPTKTLGIVQGGKNPTRNQFIIFLGKVLAAFPLNPVSMRQPKLRAGTSPGLARGARSAPAPGSAPASSGSRRCHRTEVPGAPGGCGGTPGSGGDRGQGRGDTAFSARFLSWGRSCFFPRVSVGTQGGTGDTGSCWGGGGSMDCSPAQCSSGVPSPTPPTGVLVPQIAPATFQYAPARSQHTLARPQYAPVHPQNPHHNPSTSPLDPGSIPVCSRCPPGDPSSLPADSSSPSAHPSSIPAQPPTLQLNPATPQVPPSCPKQTPAHSQCTPTKSQHTPVQLSTFQLKASSSQFNPSIPQHVPAPP